MQIERKTWVILALAALLAGGPIGCGEKEGVGERTGKALDEAAAEVKKGAEEAGEAIVEGAEEAEEAIKKGVEEAGEAIDKASD